MKSLEKSMKRKRSLSEREIVTRLLYEVARVIASSDDPLNLYLYSDSIYNKAIDDYVKEQILQIKDL
jgi:hypothetical protein